MRAVLVQQTETGPILTLEAAPDPVPGTGEVLIDVVAAGVNRADLLQAAGTYPPPPGASTVLGLECSGRIAALGPGVHGWSVGEPVCALLSGGGYADRVAVPATQLLPVPTGVGLTDAAALPEVGCTVWSNLVMVAGLHAGQTVLVHGGTSGIGTMAIQVGRALGATVAVTASRDAGLEACAGLGAAIGINYRTTDFVDALRAATQGRGADVVLDLIGAKYLERNLRALADGGHLVIIGLQGGTRAELDINALLRIRGSITATALRSRPTTGPGSKGEIVAAVRAGLWPMIEAGSVHPVVDTVLPLAQAAEAHRRMAAGGHIGKIVLVAQDDNATVER